MAAIEFDGFEQDVSDPRRRRQTVPGLQTPSTPDVFPVNQQTLPKPPTITSDQLPKLPTAPQPAQQPAPQRWSVAYERPFAALGTNPATLDWAKTYFDREGGAEEFWNRIGTFRNEATQKGHKVAEDDASIIQSDQFRNWNPGSLAAQQPQPAAQQQAVLPQAPPQPRPDVSAQFTDPITSYVESFAKQRAEQRENPPQGSGQQLLESFLRGTANQFQSGGYTPAETEIFQTQAIEPIEKLRAARKQQVMQNLSARGIPPTSGVAQQMLADVDRQMDAARIETQRTLAGNEAQERTKRMMQAIELLSGLSDQENRRLNEGFQYRNVPVQLADRGFNQAITAYNAGGNPLTLAQPLMQLSQLQAGRSNNWQQALGYLAAVLAGG